MDYWHTHFRRSEEEGSNPKLVNLRDTCVAISERHSALLQHWGSSQLDQSSQTPGVVPETIEGLAVSPYLKEEQGVASGSSLVVW